MKLNLPLGSLPSSGTLGDLKKVLPTEWCGTLPPGGVTPSSDACVTLPGVLKDALGGTSPPNARSGKDRTRRP
jgi:hypothetical protein